LWPFVTKRWHNQQVIRKWEQYSTNLLDCEQKHAYDVVCINDEHAKEVKQLKLSFKRDMEAIRKEYEQKTDRVIQPLMGIRWDEREHGRYCVQLTFDPRIMDGRFGFNKNGFDREELRWIAASFGRMVENEIASLTFVEKARESRREEYWSRMKFNAATAVQPKEDSDAQAND
jgi:hypothetical protein